MSPEELRMPMPWGHIAAKTWGSPKNERILLVHGILDNAGAFDRLISLLPRSYYYVCIDLPGHGLSSHYPRGIVLDYINYVLIICRVLDYLKWDNCIFIGHSLGAQLGMMLSSIHPERVTKIFCIDAFTSIPIQDENLGSRIQKFHNYTLSIREDSPNTKLYTKEEVLYSLMNLRINTLNVPAAEALMMRSVSKVGDKYKFNRDPRLILGLLSPLNYDQHLALIEQVKIPVTITLSTATISVHKVKNTKSLISEILLNHHYEIITIEGNHDVHNNHPERVAPHVRRFLGNIKSSL